MKDEKTQAGQFAECVAQAARYGDVGVKDLAGAVFVLWSTPETLEAAPRGRAFREAVAEVDRMTRGQAFRLDTPEGPLFEEYALWRFAGRSGCFGLEGEVSRRRGFRAPDRPIWPPAPGPARRAA